MISFFGVNGELDSTSDDWGRPEVDFWEETGSSDGDTDEVTVRVVCFVEVNTATEFEGKLVVGVWEKGCGNLLGDSPVYNVLCFGNASSREARWKNLRWWPHWITNNCMSRLIEMARKQGRSCNRLRPRIRRHCTASRNGRHTEYYRHWPPPWPRKKQNSLERQSSHDQSLMSTCYIFLTECLPLIICLADFAHSMISFSYSL